LSGAYQGRLLAVPNEALQWSGLSPLQEHGPQGGRDWVATLPPLRGSGLFPLYPALTRRANFIAAAARLV